MSDHNVNGPGRAGGMSFPVHHADGRQPDAAQAMAPFQVTQPGSHPAGLPPAKPRGADRTSPSPTAANRRSPVLKPMSARIEKGATQKAKGPASPANISRKLALRMMSDVPQIPIRPLQSEIRHMATPTAQARVTPLEEHVVKLGLRIAPKLDVPVSQQEYKAAWDKVTIKLGNAAINNRVRSRLKEICDASAPARRILVDATDGGRKAVDVVPSAATKNAAWELHGHRVLINPDKKLNGNPQAVASKVLFELGNGSLKEAYEEVFHLSQRPDFPRIAAQNPVPGGHGSPEKVLSRLVDAVEWINTRQHNIALGHASGNGVHIEPEANLYGTSFAGGNEHTSSFLSLGDYLNVSRQNGHTSPYESFYTPPAG